MVFGEIHTVFNKEQWRGGGGDEGPIGVGFR